MYGPAECTIYCIRKAAIKRDDPCSNIGKGVGSTVWIADLENSNRLTPIGAVGEILIEGSNLAREYLGNEAQTRSAFIERPEWVKSPGSSPPRRFYETGDLAFYNNDGSIDFVGRNDGQIKLRGQRLEIVEVEYRLRESLPESVEVAVSLVTVNHTEKTLAVFLVVKDTIEEIEDTIVVRSPVALTKFGSLMDGLEKKLHSILPSYMVPSFTFP